MRRFTLAEALTPLAFWFGLSMSGALRRLAALLVPLGFLFADPGDAAAAVQPIPPEWRGADRVRIPVAQATASGFLGDAYVPERICDGNRHTKWVAPTRPSAAAPQWIALTLAGGSHAIDAVAVFGERIDNDGIIDADVQVEEAGGFRTVASVRGATSPAWLATFDPASTAQIRLLIQRSGGPTDHTDVYEAEVYGRPLSDTELRARLAELRGRLPQMLAAASNRMSSAGVRLAGLPAFLRAGWDQALQAAQAPAAPESQDRHALLQAQTQAETAAGFATFLDERLQRRAAARGERAGRWARVRTEGRARLSPGAPAARLGAGEATLANGNVALWLDPGKGVWSAAWREGIAAVVSGAGFSVELDGADLAAGPAAVERREFQDALGTGLALVQTWANGGLRLERELRLYGQNAAMTLGGRIANGSTNRVRLGTVDLLRAGGEGGWELGDSWEAPAAVWIQGHSLLRSRPFAPVDGRAPPAVQEYRSSGVLALASREPATALVAGYVRADTAAPDLAATFRLDEGGAALSARSRFLGRVLGPGETIELNRLYLAAGTDPFRELEAYGEALARFAARPARTGPTGLWCSWYAHRMGMTEEKVLANAAVAARHFQPLGLEIMQLDHGWQRGDITGDWVPNERFPHGLPWLAGELRRRHGLRLGLWISPTDFAQTSELFQKHPDWALRNAEGRPLVNWRWYWKPNPDCYELDATHPEARRYIVDTFRRLTAEGASYYKIDFIASAGGEHFHQHEPRATRGWSALVEAMQAIREGAGDAAWIRYCQTPPVLGAGLASSTIGGDDTLDAGVPGRFDLLRDNGQALAAGWWLNDRAYHREVCDMSVRMQGGLEEARVRGALMALANCSISWSDELCYLPPSRIRLMQQCMPPGNPPMRPLDLFERDFPSVWHLQCTNSAEAWDTVGLFNFDRAPATRALRFADLQLDPEAEYAVFEFWEERFLGVRRGGVELNLPPESSRIVSIRKVTGVPQLIGTDLHLLQGWHEVKRLAWDTQRGVLSGVFRRMPGLRGKAFFLLPDGCSPRFEFPLSPASAQLTHLDGRLWMHEFQFAERDYAWSIPFDTPKPPAPKEPTGT